MEKGEGMEYARFDNFEMGPLEFASDEDFTRRFKHIDQQF
jgi:hypothetical protein